MEPLGTVDRQIVQKGAAQLVSEALTSAFMHSIEFTREAKKALSKMPRTTRELVISKVESLARDPFGAANVKMNRPGTRGGPFG